MGALTEAYVDVLPDLRRFPGELKSGMRRVDTDSAGRVAGQKFGTGFSSAAKKLLIAGALIKGVQALGNAMQGAWGEGTEAIKAGAQTAAVIKSTGGAAKVTAADVEKLSDAISRQTGRDDELISAGQNMLLTFTRVRNEQGKGNDIFNQATRVASDLSVATGKDLVGANVMLGKALNDPTRGLTALTRVGVTFDDGQRKQIKSMQAQGNIAGAQKIILAELRKEFGGSAAAQATFGEKAKVAWNNVKEGIGVGLIRSLDAAAPALTQIASIASATFKAFRSGVGGSKGAVQSFVDFLSTHQADIVGTFVEGGKAAIAFSLGLVSMASGGLRAMGELDAGVSRVIIGIVNKFGEILHGAAVAFSWVPGLGPKLAEADGKFQGFASRVTAGLSENGKGAIAAADKLDGVLKPALIDADGKLRSIGEREVWKAKQRDAAAAASIAIKNIGTQADGSQVKLKHWNDRTKLGADAQRALEGRVKAARLRMIEHRAAMINNDASQAALTKRWNQGREALYREFRQMGLSKEEARKLAERYSKIPKKSETKVTQPGMKTAQDDTKRLDKLIDTISDRHVKIKFSAQSFAVGGVKYKVNTTSPSAVGRGGSKADMAGVDAIIPPSHGGGGPHISESVARIPKNAMGQADEVDRWTKIFAGEGGKLLAEAVKCKVNAANVGGFPGGPAAFGKGQAAAIRAGRRLGATSVGTYPGHHPSMAKARDFMVPNTRVNARIAGHMWANRKAYGIWYVIANKRIASRTRESAGWRPYTRYGSSGSPSQMHTNHTHVAWYDQGGILPPGLTLAYNGTGRNEKVVKPGRSGTDRPINILIDLGDGLAHRVQGILDENDEFHASVGRMSR
jgi:hypothetical protein